MSWPRKNEVCRLYQERKQKSFLIVFPDQTNGKGDYDAIANAYDGPNPSLCGVTVGPLYLLNCCRRVQWSDLPENWQRAFRNIIEGTPETIRGFWKIGQQPKKSDPLDVLNSVDPSWAD